MSSYVLIAALDPSESIMGSEPFEIAGSLARERDSVSVFLTDDAVRAACAGSGEHWLSPLIDAGVSVFVDSLSLGERGIRQDSMVKGIVAAPIEHLVDLMGRRSQ